MKTKITLLIAFISWFLNPESIQAQTPEILYYNFNGTGTNVPNLALTPPVGAENATLMGALTQGGIGQCDTGALIGSGIASSTDYVNTNWAPNLGNSSWTISFWSSGISSNATLYYIFGDANTNSFRCFTNGVAGANNWILRGGGLSDITLPGGALTTPTMNTFVYDNITNTVKAYLNGVLVNTVAQTAPNITGTGPLKVMGYASNVGAPAGGMLDSFRLYNRALSDAEISGLANITVAPTVTPTVTYALGATATPLTATGTNLLWYTTATGGTGSSIAPTPSTASAGTTPYWVSQTTSCGEGPRAQIDVVIVAQASALDFDGNNDYVELGNIMPATYTKEAWFYVSNLSLHNNIISGGSDGQHAIYPTSSYGNRISAGHNGIWNAVQDPTPITANTWYHVALTYDAATTTMKLYKNGVLVATNTNVLPFVGGNALRLGSYDAAMNQLGGKLDEVRIWNRVLNECEIQNNMNSELAPGQTGLVAYYQFNQGSGSGNNTGITSITDSSGNNNNGTLVNFALSGATSNWVNPGAVTTGTTSPIYNIPNVNTVANQTLCANATTAAVTFSSTTTGTICGQTNEGGTINLTAPTGFVFTAIPFASYGTPNGSCGNFTLGSCHAAISTPIVSSFGLNENSFSIPASNGIFGDPCPFTAKRLYIEAVYNNTTFTWTNDTPSIGLAASGTGDIASFTATNTGSSPIVATITVTPTVNGCSGTPIQYTITVNPTPNTPTGSATQVINVGVAADATIEDIIVNPTTVTWYSSSSDALAGINALPAGTQLTDGATYYAVNYENTCSSTPFAVTVTVVLGNDTFDSTTFSAYPNPTSDVVSVKYSSEISEVSVYNLLGQMVINKKTNANEVTIDLANLPSATYLMKVISEGKIKMVKVIKR